MLISYELRLLPIVFFQLAHVPMAGRNTCRLQFLKYYFMDPDFRFLSHDFLFEDFGVLTRIQ